MAEYINMEAAVKAFNNFDTGKSAGTHSTLLTPEEFAEYLYELPTADVAPVVRCKDCEYSYNTSGRRRCLHGICCGRVVPPNFYCAEGKRKENE